MGFTGRIYCFINKINNKKYIGQTSQSLSRRKNEHIYESKRNDNIKFHNAIRKYGIENFELLELKLFSCSSKNLLKNQLNVYEIEYINQYNTIKNGYNTASGGLGHTGLIGKDSKRSIPVLQYDLKGNLIKE